MTKQHHAQHKAFCNASNYGQSHYKFYAQLNHVDTVDMLDCCQANKQQAAYPHPMQNSNLTRLPVNVCAQTMIAVFLDPLGQALVETRRQRCVCTQALISTQCQTGAIPVIALHAVNEGTSRQQAAACSGGRRANIL